ncbi:MAG: hypothetical protein ABF256_06910 [Candidatus Arcticimaribacter sp.]
MKKTSFFILLTLIFFSCKEDAVYKNRIQEAELFHSSVKNLSDIIVYDIFSLPVASRIYMYPTIAAYEIMAQAYPQNYKSLAGQLKDLEKISPMTQDVNPHLATLYAYNFVGKALIFSEDKMDDFQRKQAMKIKAIGVPRRVRKASLAYAEKVSAHILNWANGDLYNQTRTFSRYTIQEEDHFWKPTPPDYMDGIEPHWNKIRTLVIDSANQYQPKAPLSFDLSKGSPFQKQLQQVYDISKVLTDEQVEIAKFWDCNPYLTHHRGHAMFATKRLLLEGTGSGLLPSLPEKHKVILPKR